MRLKPDYSRIGALTSPDNPLICFMEHLGLVPVNTPAFRIEKKFSDKPFGTCSYILQGASSAVSSMHRACGAQHAEIRGGQRQKGLCKRPEDNLSCSGRTDRTGSHGRGPGHLGGQISRLHEPLERQLGLYQSHVQVLPDRPEGHVHDGQCYRESEQRLPPSEPWAHDLPQHHGPDQGALPGHVGADEKMEHTRSQLGAGLCGAGRHVSRQADPELAACRDWGRGRALNRRQP